MDGIVFAIDFESLIRLWQEKERKFMSIIEERNIWAMIHGK